MSGKNNVNPGQYKVGGRERTDVLAKERLKDTRQEQAIDEARTNKKLSRPPAAKKQSAKKAAATPRSAAKRRTASKKR